jgi:hypothetical protein
MLRKTFLNCVRPEGFCEKPVSHCGKPCASMADKKEWKNFFIDNSYPFIFAVLTKG